MTSFIGNGDSTIMGWLLTNPHVKYMFVHTVQCTKIQCNIICNKNILLTSFLFPNTRKKIKKLKIKHFR